MITAQKIRKIALSSPEATEKGHFGEPSFRIRNKIFAALYPKEKAITLKLSLEYQLLLVENDPAIFYLAGWAHQGWTRARLDVIDGAHLEHVIAAAWKNVAPKRLVKAFEAGETT